MPTFGRLVSIVFLHVELDVMITHHSLSSFFGFFNWNSFMELLT